MAPRTLTTSLARHEDLLTLQNLAQMQVTRQHQYDPRLPDRAYLARWMIFSQDSMAWVAHDDRHYLGLVAASPDIWSESDPLANVFPRQYLRLKIFLADTVEPVQVLPVLIQRVDGWVQFQSLPGQMCMAPFGDTPLVTALRGLGFKPFHVISTRQMDVPPVMPAPDGLQFRAATREDIPAVAAIMADSWAFHARYQPLIALTPALLQGAAEKAAGLLGDGEMSTTLLALLDGEVVGFFCVGLELQQPGLHAAFLAEGLYGDIVEVAVREDCRQRGVGLALFREVWAWFAARDVTAIFVNYAPTNPLSSRFWPRLGFVRLLANWYRP